LPGREITFWSGHAFHIIEAITELTKGNYLYENQVAGMRELFLGNSVADISETGSGKTVIALIALLLAVDRKQVGVYLFPTTALRDMHYEKIKQVLNKVYGKYAPYMVLLDDYLRVTILKKRRVIVFATYEKFMAEYEKVSHAKGFHNRRWIGSVVVDEAHTLGGERGGLLEVFLRKLMVEQAPQIVFLSATFDNIDEWSKIFNLVVLPKHKSNRRVIRRFRVAHGKLEKITFLKEDLREFFRGSDGDKRLAIVFCGSRKTTEKLEKVAKEEGYNAVSVHAYKGNEANRTVLSEVMQWDNGVIFSTTLLMPGLDFRNVSLIIFFDAGLPYFTGTVLKQGEGRSRESHVNVILYFQYGDDIASKIIFDEDTYEVYDYKVNKVTSRIKDSDVVRTIMSFVAVGPKSKSKIRQFLIDLGLLEYASKLDDLLKEYKILFRRKGWVRLSELGNKLLMAYATPAIRGLFNNDEWKKKSVVQKILTLHERLVGVPSPGYESLIQALLETKKDFVTIAMEHNLEEGQLEGERKKLAWLATILSLFENDMNAKKEIKQLLLKARTYPAAKRPSFFKREPKSKNRINKELLKKLMDVLKNSENGLSIGLLQKHFPDTTKKSLYDALEILVKERKVKKLTVYNGMKRCKENLYFDVSKSIPEYLFNVCGECIFFSKCVYGFNSYSICELHGRPTTKKSIACPDYYEKKRRHYFVVDDWYYKQPCVICGHKMRKNYICPNCGTVYVYKPNGKIKVIPGNLDIKQELLSLKKGKSALSLNFKVIPWNTLWLHINADDEIKISDWHIKVKRYGKSRYDTYHLLSVKKITFHGYHKLTPHEQEILEDLGIQIFYSNPPSFTRTPVELRKKLQSLPINDKSIKCSYVAKVITELLSDTIMIKQLTLEYNVNIPFINYTNAILSTIVGLLIKYSSGNITPSIARAFEGAGKGVTWAFLKKILRGMVNPRVISRFMGYRFRKAAMSPFHASLNYFYTLLTRRARSLLSKVGLSYFDPGPGLIHRHDNYHFRRDEGILFDFIDMFRPVFLHENVRMWLTGTLTNNLFVRYKIGSVGNAYVVSPDGQDVLKRHFSTLLNKKFLTLNGKQSLNTILWRSTRELKHWIDDYSKQFPLFFYILDTTDCRFLIVASKILNLLFYNVKPWMIISNRLSLIADSNSNYINKLKKPKSTRMSIVTV